VAVIIVVREGFELVAIDADGGVSRPTAAAAL
jgi:hypothetical protein